MTKIFVLLGTCGEILPWVKFSVLLHNLLLLILSVFIRKKKGGGGGGNQNESSSSFPVYTAQ